MLSILVKKKEKTVEYGRKDSGEIQLLKLRV